MGLVDGVELRVEALPQAAVGEEGEPLGRDRVNLRQLVRHLEPEAGRRRLDDAPADRLAVNALHRERLAAVDLAEVGDRLGCAHAGLARGDDHLVLVAQGERVEMDHPSAGPAYEQLATVGEVDRPGLLGRTSRELHRVLDAGAERLLERVPHPTSSASSCSASGWRACRTSVVAPHARQASSRSAMRALSPTSATSSTSASGTAAIASPLRPSR